MKEKKSKRLTKNVIRNSSGVEYSNSSNFIITEARIRETAVGLLRKLKRE